MVYLEGWWAVVLVTKAIDVQCPKCKCIPGFRCKKVVFCVERVMAAAKLTREANKAAKVSRHEGDGRVIGPTRGFNARK